MLVRQGFQYALRLKAQREAVLRRWVGCRRFVFNEALAHQRAEMAAGRRRPGHAALCARLPALKAQHPWLCEPPAQALQQALKDLCAAWDRKFTSRFGSPRFKKKGAGDTLRLPQDCKYDAAAGVVHLPKLGAVRLRHSREALGELKNVTLRQERGRWFAALQTEREFEVLAPATTAVVGLDFGAATAIMPSDGQACNACGHTAAQNRKSQSLFSCVACGHTENADRNAAKNILRRGEQILSGGRPTSTAGCAGTHACEGAATPRRRPRSAARGGSDDAGLPAEPALAGTVSGLSLPGNLHP